MSGAAREDGAADGASDSAPTAAIRCPFCHSEETEEMAVFGSRLSTATYYCRACHTPFEYIHRAPDATPR